MYEKIKALRAQRAELIKAAQAALEASEIEKAEEIKGKLVALNRELELATDILNEAGKTLKPIDSDRAPEDNAPKKDAGKGGVRASNEYITTFIKALRSGLSVDDAFMRDEYAILRNAMTEGGGTPVGADGGFLVPTDIDNSIIELRRAFVDLASLLTIENVNTLSGWRVRENAANLAKYVVLSEMGTIPEATSPQFIQVPYKIKDYGGIIPASNQLLADSAVNVIAYLSKWMARMGVNTSNGLILTMLGAISGSVYDVTKGIGPLKTALNKTLDPVFSLNATILTNQSGLDVLDQMKDTTGRPLLQPDVVDRTTYRALGRRIVVAPDSVVPNATGTGKPAPMYIGDFKSFATEFRRQPLELASTNVGAGAFETNATKFRAIQRMDLVSVDSASVVKLTIATE